MGKSSRKKGEPVSPSPLTPPLAPGSALTAFRPHLAALAALWILALIAYANSFGGDLARDNTALIRDDARIRAVTADNLNLILTREYWYGNSTSELYRPVTTLSFLFNYAVLGNGPRTPGYHWLNFALHALNIALVYLLMIHVLRERGLALAAAAVWSVHPALTESVTNLVGRADLLAGLGIFGGLLCHIRASAAAGRRRLGWLAALAAVVAVGMFSKESAVAVVAVLLLHDVALRAAGGWRAAVAGYAAAALPCVVFLAIRHWVLAHTLFARLEFTDNPLVGADFWTARLTALRVMGEYLRILVWPVRLSADYSYNQIPLFTWRMDSPDDWKTLAGVLLCVALVATGVWGFRRNRTVFFLVFFALATLAATSNLILLIGTIMAERFLYVPAAAFAAGAVLAGQSVCRRLAETRPGTTNAPRVLLAVVVLALAGRTFARNFDWADERSIQTAAVAATPGSFRGHMALASLLTGSAESAAEADRTRAILDPLPDERQSMRAYLAVGVAYRLRGDRVGGANSAPLYRKSLDTLLRARSAEQAHDRVNRAENQRRGRPNTSFAWAPVYLELGRTYLKLQQPREALEALRHGRSVALQTEFFEEMAAAYRALGDPAAAATTLFEGLVIDTTQTQLSAQLAELYGATAPDSCAVTAAGQSRSVNLECPLVKGHFCAALWNTVRLYREHGAEDTARRTAAAGQSQYGCPPEK
jgi:protein O-mannosyl-transferase